MEPDRGSDRLPRMPLDGMVPSPPTVPPVSDGDGAVTVGYSGPADYSWCMLAVA